MQTHAHLRINELAIELADDHGALFWSPILEKHHFWPDNHEFFDHLMYLGTDCLLFLYTGLPQCKKLAHLRILYAKAAASVASMVATPMITICGNRFQTHYGNVIKVYARGEGSS